MQDVVADLGSAATLTMVTVAEDLSNLDEARNMAREADVVVLLSGLGATVGADQPDANLLNDGAVLLHYYLHRDYDKAQEMYEKSIEIATDLLAKPDKLTAEQKAAAQKAKKEATDNLQNLAKGIHDWRG